MGFLDLALYGGAAYAGYKILKGEGRELIGQIESVVGTPLAEKQNGVAGMGNLGALSQSTLDTITDLQNRITQVNSGITGIGRDNWEAYKGAFIQYVMENRPGFGYTPYDSLKTDLQRAINWILFTPAHEPTPTDISNASMIVTSAERQLDLMRMLVPSTVAQKSVTEEAETKARVENLPTLRSPEEAGEQAFYKTLRERAEALAEDVTDPLGLGISLPVLLIGGVGLYFLLS